MSNISFYIRNLQVENEKIPQKYGGANKNLLLELTT
jgi:hypothetical protein